MNLFRLCGDVLGRRRINLIISRLHDRAEMPCAVDESHTGLARRLDRRPRAAPERDEERRRHLAQDPGALFDRLRGALRGSV